MQYQSKPDPNEKDLPGFMKYDPKKEKMYLKLKKEWTENVIPYWGEKRANEQLKELCYQGIPPSIRSQVWCLVIPNRLTITKEF